MHEGDAMVLTRGFGRAKRPCIDGFLQFAPQFGEGDGDQVLLDTMGVAGPARVAYCARGMT